MPIELESVIAEPGQSLEPVEVPPKTKIDKYPLFSLPVRIEKEISKKGMGKYTIYFVDGEIQVNIGVLQSVLGEELYFQLLDELGKYEMEGRLTLPIINLELFSEIWGQIKAQLKLSEAIFNESSFQLEDVTRKECLTGTGPLNLTLLF